MNDKPMSTCNFGQPNLSKIYSVGARYEDIDYDCELGNIAYYLEKIQGYIPHKGRSYGRYRHTIGYFQWECMIDEKWDTYTLSVVVENGYYCGFSIDIEHDEYATLDDVSLTMRKKIEAKMRKIERVLQKCTTPIVRVAVFSNGEGVYRLA